METVSIEQEISNGLSKVRSAYWRMVRSDAESMRDEIKDGDIADREALIGRSETAEDALSRTMWNTLATGLDVAPRSREAEIIEALEATASDLETRLRAAEQPSSDIPPIPAPAIEVGFAALERQIGDWRERTQAELDDALGETFRRLTGREYRAGTDTRREERR